MSGKRSVSLAQALPTLLLGLSLAIPIALLPGVQAASAQDRKADPRAQAAAQHRTIAQAHEKAAQCLEAGTPEKTCQEALQQACRGIAIGRYCGMKRSRQVSAGAS